MQDDPEKMLSDWVRYHRDERDWTQSELAQRLSAVLGEPIGATSITRLEKGKRSISFNETVALLAVFDKTFGDLVAYFNTVYDFGGVLERTPDREPTLLEVAEQAESIMGLAHRMMQEALEEHRAREQASFFDEGVIADG